MGRKAKIIKKESWFTEGVKSGIMAIFLFVLATILVMASFGASGPVGNTTFRVLHNLTGIGYYLIPTVLAILGLAFLKFSENSLKFLKIIFSLILYFSGLGIIEIGFQKGGAIGYYLSMPFIKLFDIYAGILILGAIFLASLLIILEAKLNLNWLKSLLTLGFLRKKPKVDEDTENIDGEEETKEEAEEENKESEETGPPQKQPSGLKGLFKKTNSDPLEDDSEFEGFTRIGKVYIPPPLSLLERDKGKPIVGDIKANANIIKRTLLNFGIHVEMDEVSIGPSVTRYAIKPAEGVKLSKIAALQDNLAYALAAHPIRIEAPIPGKSLVGIEIPNSTKSIIGMTSMLASVDYKKSDKPLLMGLGRDISGGVNFADLAKMPHLLIAGATGSGKSVTIHAIINSLIFRNAPETLKFIMIDPKRVELTLYNKIPHLLTPVITNAKKAILALKWAAKEMERRYEILESHAVRDVNSYHKNVVLPIIENKNKNPESEEIKTPDLMPYIVIVIDELADIMATYPRELEASIVRLAQMSRAVGIHLILSTQRPSVNVITGLIKANIPGRIALQVSSQIDSRTILDSGGAEKLLGAGDMLYLGGEMSKPRRIQSAFISENEVKKVSKYLKDTYADEIMNEIAISDDGPETDKNDIASVLENANFSSDNEEIDDDLYEQAREEIIKAGKASTSYIQRRLRVGYSRAARLMDMLEERGVIGPSDGSKPREVLANTSPESDYGTATPETNINMDNIDNEEKDENRY